jgi:hypothetical protein
MIVSLHNDIVYSRECEEEFKANGEILPNFLLPYLSYCFAFTFDPSFTPPNLL